MSESHENITYRSDMGHKAIVDRKELKNDKTGQANRSLELVGKHLEPPGLKYVGTAAVHVYLKKGLIGDELAFICQTGTLTSRVAAPVADDAALELSKQLKFFYTGKMEVKRSGF